MDTTDSFDTLNGTIDPACLKEPPLAMDVIRQMDEFTFCLYVMLSFMSFVSFVLYLEQCVYIYKHLPYPKKTTIIWVNGAAPVIATMSCFGMWIPRAVMITDMTSNCLQAAAFISAHDNILRRSYPLVNLPIDLYFAVVVYKVLILMIQEFGGTSKFLERFAGKTVRINTGPCCCCCCCLPRVPMTRGLIFWLKIGALQYAILKTVLSVLSVVLWTNGNFDLSDLEINSTAIWINPFIGVLTITSLWPVAIVFMNSNSHMRSINMVPKYAMYQLVLVLSQLQTSVINILALDGTIACSPPFSSQARGSLLSQQMMIMEMFIISLYCRFLYRRTYDKIPPETDGIEVNVQDALKAHVAEHDV